MKLAHQTFPKVKESCHGELIGQQSGDGLASPVSRSEKTTVQQEARMQLEEKL